MIKKLANITKFKLKIKYLKSLLKQKDKSIEALDNKIRELNDLNYHYRNRLESLELELQKYKKLAYYREWN